MRSPVPRRFRDRRRSCACCGSLRGSTRPRLPRAAGPSWRVSSPTPGRSSLTTSAPRSASSIVQYGPASTRERSSTRMDESGTRRSSHAATPAAGAARSIRSAEVSAPPAFETLQDEARRDPRPRQDGVAPRLGPADADAAARRRGARAPARHASASSRTSSSSPTRSARCSRSCVRTRRASTTTRSRRA